MITAFIVGAWVGHKWGEVGIIVGVLILVALRIASLVWADELISIAHDLGRWTASVLDRPAT